MAFKIETDYPKSHMNWVYALGMFLDDVILYLDIQNKKILVKNKHESLATWDSHQDC